MPRRPDRHRPVTALVFAGGGSLGAVQVGMLKAFVTEGVETDLAVGASVGALNAVYFAGDPTLDGVFKLEQIWRALRRDRILPIAPLTGLLVLFAKRNHFIKPHALARLIRRHLPFRRLEEAQIPCHVVATDLFRSSTVSVRPAFRPNLRPIPIAEANLYLIQKQKRRIHARFLNLSHCIPERPQRLLNRSATNQPQFRLNDVRDRPAQLRINVKS
ncbi:MAG: hypothetical protein Kow0060_18830 [Methylohalobius crimeensis]